MFIASVFFKQNTKDTAQSLRDFGNLKFSE